MRFGLRELLFMMVLVAMPLASYWFVFRPQNRDIAQARKEIDHKEQVLEKLSAATSRNEDIRKVNQEIASGIDLVEGRLPDNKEVDVVLEQVATLARDSRLALPKVRSAKPVPAAAYMEQPLEMLITGDFDDFYGFLLRLEGLERITRMPELKVKKLDAVDGAMEATFTLSIYFEPGNTPGEGGGS